MFRTKMEDVCERLRALEEAPPWKPEVVNAFSTFLASRPMLDGPVSPEGLAVTLELAVLDLSRGRDGYTRTELEHELVGMNLGVLIEVAISVSQVAYSDQRLQQQVNELVQQSGALQEFRILHPAQ